MRTTVLPDHDDGEHHPWEWLAELLRTAGVPAMAHALKSLPDTVEFGERLLQLLGSTKLRVDG
ncbi:MAG: hypothetical protein M3P04_13630 [Actinomycetota bacterium]|nr:hypothetical protein [Actinomycetota bacterium]